MAIYNNIALSGDGALGEALTIPGAPYTFTFTNTNTANPPTGDSTNPFNTNDCYFIMNSNRATYEGSEFTGTGTNVGALKGGLIPLSNVINGITGAGINATFIFDVDGDLQGSSAQIALTATLLDGDATATITRANVIRGGQNFTSGDGITISLNDIQAAGFTNATNPVAPFTGGLQMDIFPNHIDGWYTPADLAGTFGTTTGDLTTTNFVYNYRNSGSSLEVLTSVGFKLKQTLDTPLAAGVIGSFQYTPTATIQALTYTLQCTGNVSLNIT
jgi:hypothetical protein